MTYESTISRRSVCTKIVSVYFVMTFLLGGIVSRSSSSRVVCFSSFTTPTRLFFGGSGATPAPPAPTTAFRGKSEQFTPAFIHASMMSREISNSRSKKRQSSSTTSTPATVDDDKDNQQQVGRDRPTQYYLMKSEPSEFSIYDLQTNCGPDMEDDWDGVRNYQARNIMRSMQYGDIAFFYHSSCNIPAIVGTMKIVSHKSYPDITAVDPNHKGYDKKSKSTELGDSRWDCVRVQLKQIFDEPITLSEIKQYAKDGNDIIANMKLLRNTRLSVQDLTKEEYDTIEEISHQKENAKKRPKKDHKS